MLIAEGGTEHNHSVCVARSKTIDGWYEGNPCNPVLTHRHLGYSYPIENIGHADLIDTPDGNWYAVCLGVRLIQGQHMNLGRETFLCPVRFERGWPVFSPDCGKVEWEYSADQSLPWKEAALELKRDDFDLKDLALCWNFWGTPYEDFWKIENSRLKLKCLPRTTHRALRAMTGRTGSEPERQRKLSRTQTAYSGFFFFCKNGIFSERKGSGRNSGDAGFESSVSLGKVPGRRKICTQAGFSDYLAKWASFSAGL